jgi:DNA-binding transcriptional LysR family regulator
MRGIPPIHLIVTFDAVTRRQSFNQAADDLNISYSAVSHRVRELEKLLGTKLFNRTTRVVSLSPEGAYLHQQMKTSLETLAAAFSGFAHERDVIRISALPSFGRFRLVPALTEFHRTHPAISIALLPTTRTVNINQGEADIAIRFARDKPEVFHAELLLEDEWFPVASPRYLHQIGPLDSLQPSLLFARIRARHDFAAWTHGDGLAPLLVRRGIASSVSAGS